MSNWNNGGILYSMSSPHCLRLLSHNINRLWNQMSVSVVTTQWLNFLSFTELTWMTWRTSSPSSSWVPSTPWPDLRWPWPASTSSFSLRAACCTALPTCLPCERRPAPWPTPSPRYHASPWLCRFSLRLQRTPKYPETREWSRSGALAHVMSVIICGLCQKKQDDTERPIGRENIKDKNISESAIYWEVCDYTSAGLCQYFLLFYYKCENVSKVHWSWHLVLFCVQCKWRLLLFFFL